MSKQPLLGIPALADLQLSSARKPPGGTAPALGYFSYLTPAEETASTSRNPPRPLSFLPNLQGLGELEKEGSMQHTRHSFKVAEIEQPEML